MCNETCLKSLIHSMNFHIDLEFVFICCLLLLVLECYSLCEHSASFYSFLVHLSRLHGFIVVVVCILLLAFSVRVVFAVIRTFYVLSLKSSPTNTRVQLLQNLEVIIIQQNLSFVISCNVAV